ncbi:MAG: hypothetical protein ACLP9L_18255 [Thermoguttaceae bacterium]
MQIYQDMPGFKVTATTLSIDYNIIQATDGLIPGTGNPLDYTAVRAALLQYVPVSNAPPGATYAWPRRGMDLKEVGWGIWKATIQWASLTYQYALKIGGSSQQIRCDKSLVTFYSDSSAPSGAVPNYSAGDKGRPIGWDGRSVHGCSIYTPTRSWTESVEIPISDYSFDYEDAVANINEAPVNSSSFRGYDPGEVQFHGMQVQLSTQNPDFVTAAYEFEQITNRNSGNGNQISIDNITGINKDGWDFLDVHYAPTIPSGTQAMVPKALYVLIHRVYDRSDFTGLNIGTGETLPTWQGTGN